MVIHLGDIIKLNQSNKIMIVNHHKPKNILFLGSCRIYAFLNYFLHDPFFGKNFNYLCILVYLPEMVELSLRKDSVQSILQVTTLLVSEYIQHFNYFNSSTECSMNLFQLHPLKHTIFLPNYYKRYIYAKDMLNHPDMTVLYQQFINNEISQATFQSALLQFQEHEMDKFCAMLRKSCMPELESFIKTHFRTKRIAYTINHPSNFLLLEMYAMILKKFGRTIPPEVMKMNSHEFLDSHGYESKLTIYDRWLNYQINEPYYDKIQSDIYVKQI